MSESNLEGIDAVLSDRLRELGLDYVANVLEGKRQPSASQLMFLRTGHAFPIRNQIGTLLVGGTRDGERVPFADPETRRFIQVPDPMRRDGQVSTRVYRALGMYGARQAFWFYLLDSMESDEGYQSLIDNYRSPNSVENHHGQG